MVTTVTDIEDGWIIFVDLAAALQSDNCAVRAYGCYALVINAVNGLTPMISTFMVREHLTVSIRKTLFYIMALTHVLIKHNDTLHVLLLPMVFDQDIRGK